MYSHYYVACKNTKYFVNIILLADTQLLDNASPLPANLLLYETPSLLFPVIFYKNIGYDIKIDAKNIKLPGTMWGMHYDVDQTVYSHIKNLTRVYK